MLKNARLTFDKSRAFTERLERLVPGGAHTYSKGRDQFPVDAPSGIVSGNGCRVIDADGNNMIDWSMGLTSVSLGHAHPAVSEAVIEAVHAGVNYQRPSYLELDAAEMFLDATGCDMVKFAKHGSSVVTAAVKLARAHTARAKVAIPREHPFFSFDDWFIATTAADFGIPTELKNYAVHFSYNDIDSLARIFSDHPDEIAAVLMEPVKFDPPENDFIAEAAALTRTNGAVFILDEMVSGFKWDVPGAGRFFGVEPDISTWGKGIANGFSAAALAGRGEIMRIGGLEPEGDRKLFLLSTTHGAESTGLAAMCKTLEILRDRSVIASNWEKGAKLKAALQNVISKHALNGWIAIIGYDCLLTVTVMGPDGNPDESFRTLLLQELIDQGILFQGILYPTPAHGEKEIELTVEAFDSACGTMAQAYASRSVEGLLRGPACKPVFRRYR